VVRIVIEGSCTCGSVHWSFDGTPELTVACNCTACRRYAVLWAYDYEGERIRVEGGTSVYVRGDAIEFHFCPTCGNLAFWRGQRDNEHGKRRIAVNLRLAEPAAVADIPVEHLDGLVAFEPLPDDGRRVRDYWF
jgi:hypothetical protein